MTGAVGTRVATLKTTIEAGALIRKDIRRALNVIAHHFDLDLSVTEDRGWVDSMLYVRARGSEDGVRALMAYLQRVEDEA